MMMIKYSKTRMRRISDSGYHALGSLHLCFSFSRCSSGIRRYIERSCSFIEAEAYTLK